MNNIIIIITINIYRDRVVIIRHYPRRRRPRPRRRRARAAYSLRYVKVIALARRHGIFGAPGHHPGPMSPRHGVVVRFWRHFSLLAT
jgi:hypothetical protein